MDNEVFSGETHVTDDKYIHFNIANIFGSILVPGPVVKNAKSWVPLFEIKV